ncbi:MAG TPA: ATP-binding protein [Burkholderiales bacterium]|nr:ATP-binding protein [Burkholderiales bacterium]
MLNRSTESSVESNRMEEEKNMGLNALVSQHEDQASRGETPYEHHVTPVPTQALARLDRFATASLLATGLAHEIANPLSTLLAALDWATERVERMRKRGQGSEDAIHLERLAPDVELAMMSAQSIAALVRDFQLFLRPDEITPVIGAAEVKPAIERALQMARVRLKSVSPVSAELGEAPTVRVPSTRITQIVLNLLLNAADALADRPWSANSVEVRLETVNGRAVIEVRDNGPGLGPEAQRHLFEPGHTGRATGSGLGLAISRQLARLSGGDITVTCPPTAGTIFRVVLPPAG